MVYSTGPVSDQYWHTVLAQCCAAVHARTGPLLCQCWPFARIGPVLAQYGTSGRIQYWPSIGPVMVYGIGPVLAQYWASGGLRYWPSTGPVLGQYWLTVLAQCCTAVHAMTGPLLGQCWLPESGQYWPNSGMFAGYVTELSS